MAQYSETIPHRIPFWFKPISTFGLFKLTTFNRSSHMLVVPTHPLLLSAFVLADSASPCGWAYRVSGGYVVPRASHRAVTGSACLGRERLMEQPVSSGHRCSSETETHATCRSHKHILGQVDPNCRNLHDGCPFRFEWLVTLPLWHIDAVTGWGRPSHCLRISRECSCCSTTSKPLSQRKTPVGGCSGLHQSARLATAYQCIAASNHAAVADRFYRK
ncbi:hypothetical protein LMG23992_05103 [Cupriavidus laharis]|uniref:Uncharacterized protein n=1 Tax=Cupriavidus laharis TaxID=151654 RepID=A0ABM8XU53_9BURK|nr:hypothetical protein LMG23992_05103 [Cupriavidus laharis]